MHSANTVPPTLFTTRFTPLRRSPAWPPHESHAARRDADIEAKLFEPRKFFAEPSAITLR